MRLALCGVRRQSEAATPLSLAAQPLLPFARLFWPWSPGAQAKAVSPLRYATALHMAALCARSPSSIRREQTCGGRGPPDTLHDRNWGNVPGIPASTDPACLPSPSDRRDTDLPRNQPAGTGSKRTSAHPSPSGRGAGGEGPACRVARPLSARCPCCSTRLDLLDTARKHLAREQLGDLCSILLTDGCARAIGRKRGRRGR